MSKKVRVHVGTVADMGRRFVDAWHRLEHGERVRERHVTFPDLGALLNALTPRRLELLGKVHAKPAPSVRALAQRLGRDYRRVHGDVAALVTVGLLVRDEAGISAPYDMIHADLDLRAVP
jgi:predicted transcriptional regulator